MSTILQDIEKQRWISFENDGEISFDRNSGLFWAEKKDNYSGYDEAKTYAKTINSKKLGGFNDWNFPTPAEITDFDGAPFSYYLYRIWCFQSEDIQAFDVTTGEFSKKRPHNQNARAMLCRRADSTDSKDLIFIFLKNKLIPLFNDDKIKQLYLQLYSGKIDSNIFLDGYNLGAVEQSPLQYYEAVVSVADEVLDYLEYCGDSSKVDEVKQQIRTLKIEAAEFSSRLRKIYCSRNILSELAEIEREPRPSFIFVVDSLVKIIKLALEKV